MARKLDELFIKIDGFAKAAGTLKVPENLLADVFNYVRAQYCKIVVDHLGKKVEAAQKRNKIQDNIYKLEENWQTIDSIIEEIRLDYKLEYKNNPQLLKESLDKLATISSKLNLNIPKFNMRQKDFGNWLGVIDKGDNVFFRFEKSGKNKYRLDYFIKISKIAYDEVSEGQADSNVKSQKLEISKSNLTDTEAAALLSELYQNNSIAIPSQYLEYLKYSWETLDNKYFLHLKTVYGQCIKYSEMEEISESKFFRLSRENFPYKIEFPQPTDFEFKVRFVTSDQTSKIYDKEPWGGLWESSGYNTPYRHEKAMTIRNLGTVYVAGNPIQDAKVLDNLQDLDNKLSELKKTTRHELQHFMQTLLGWLTKKPGEMNERMKEKGLPSKKIMSPEYDIHGRPIGSTNNKLDHALRDIEFYTRLSDSIEKFNHFKTMLPVHLHPLLAKAWIRVITIDDFKNQLMQKLQQEYAKMFAASPQYKGRWSTYTPDYQQTLIKGQVNEYSSVYREPVNAAKNDTFFEELKNAQPGKYRKAASEFIKAVL